MVSETHYTGSDGKRHEIAAMPYPHLNSALAKLERTPLAMDTRAPEIEAMRDRKAVLDAEYIATDTGQEQAREALDRAAALGGAALVEWASRWAVPAMSAIKALTDAKGCAQ